MVLQGILEIFRIIASVLFLFLGGYLFILSMTEVYKQYDGMKMTRRAAVLRVRYLSGTVICGFLAAEFFIFDIICVPFLFLFLGLVWLEYLINIGVISLLNK